LIEHGSLKGAEILLQTDPIKIDASYAGTIISGLMFSRKDYQGSLHEKLRESIGKPLEDVGKMEVYF
jgi:hypothetical protein